MASTHVLEAVIVACIMVSAVAYVATHDAPHPHPYAVDRVLEKTLTAYLNLLDESSPTRGACDAEDQIEQLLVEGMSGERRLWDGRERFWPAGLVRNLYVDNGRALYPLYEKWDFVGHAERRTVFPFFTHLEIQPESSTPTGVDPLIVQIPALQHSMLVKPKGEAVHVQVVIDGATAVIDHEAWAPTALLDTGQDRRDHSTNLTWRHEGVPSLVAALEPTALLGRERGSVQHFFINVSSPRGQLATEMRLDVQLPANWNVTDVVEASWEYTWLANDSRGPTLQFRRGADQLYSEEIRISAFPPLNVTGRAFDIFHAYLSGGSFAQSSLVVVYPREGDTNAGQLDLREGRVVLPTTPYPMSLGNASLFGVAFANGGEDTVVRRVNIEVPGGYDHHRHNGAGSALFKEGVPEVVGGPTDGTWTWVDARHLQWRGAREVPAGQATQWIISVNATSDPTQTTSIEHAESKGFHSTLTFENGFVSTSALWGRLPGVIEHRVPPASDGAGTADGYPHLPNGSTEPLTHTMSARLVTTRGALEDTGTYVAVPATGEATAGENSLKDSYFRVSDRIAPLKSTVVARADFRSLISSVPQDALSDLSVRMDLYAPPTFGCAPVHTWTRDLTNLPKSSVKDVLIHDFLGAGAHDVIVAHEDGNVSRWDATLTHVWMTSVGASATHLAPAPPNVGGAIFVGDAAGRVHRINHATGELVWSTAASGAGISRLLVDVRNETILVGTSNGVIASFNVFGTKIAEFVAGGSVRSISTPTAMGTIVVDAEHELFVLDAMSLAPVASYSAANGLGAAVGTAGILRATSTNVTLHDAEDLDVILSDRLLGGSLTLQAAGDVDADGADDLVAAREDLTLIAWSGATGARLWTVEPTWLAPPPANGHATYGVGAIPGVVAENRACRDYRIEGERYGGEPVCDYVQRRENPTELALRVSTTGTAFAYAWDGFSSVTFVDPTGTPAWTQSSAKGTTITSVAQGSHAGVDVVAVGKNEGTVTLLAASGGGPHGSVAPSLATGQFALSLQVPGGGFFGTHILVATVSWNTVDGLPQEARLVDWFHVVDVDGTPVDLPAYDLVLIAYYQDEPLGPNRQPK